MSESESGDLGASIAASLETLAQCVMQVVSALKRIEQKLPDVVRRPDPKQDTKRPARTFTRGQTIPLDVDLVVANGGLRWVRLFDPEEIQYGSRGKPLDLWTPRDIGSPTVSGADLLSLVGSVTEIPDPTEQRQTPLVDVPDQIMPARPNTWPDDPRRLNMPPENILRQTFPPLWGQPVTMALQDHLLRPAQERAVDDGD